jgi:hypothetical protein
MLQRFLLLWLILLSLLAFGWPAWFGEIPDPFRATAAGLNVLFAVTMLAIGSLLPADEIRQVARRWPTVLGGTTVQYLAMPLLAYALARLFQLEGAALIGVLEPAEQGSVVDLELGAARRKLRIECLAHACRPRDRRRDSPRVNRSADQQNFSSSKIGPGACR